MASTDNRPSQSLINAAVASLVGGAGTGMITSGATAGIISPGIGSTAGIIGSAIGATAGSIGSLFGGAAVAALFPTRSSPVDIVDLYFSSMIPSVSAAGISIRRQTLQGPLQIDMQCLSPEFDRDFTNKRDGSKTFVRGNYPYVRPCGSYRMALNVKDKFGNDNAWIGMTGTAAGEWPVSYHGTAKNNALNIGEEGYKLSEGTRFRFGEGIYSTPELDVAKRYATRFRHDGTSYLCILQNRVNPKYLKVIPASMTRRGTYWLSAGDSDRVVETELIRPYGICLFKQD